MERPSSYLQVALGSLAFVAIGYIISLYVIANQLVPGQPPLPALAAPYISLIIALAFFSLPLLWWRNPLGYVGAIVTGVLAMVNYVFVIFDIADGTLPQEVLIAIVPSLVIAGVLVGSTVAAWRE